MSRLIEMLESRNLFAVTPGLLVDIVAVSTTGTGVSITNAGKGISVTNSSKGGSVTFEVRATITGDNTSTADDSLFSIAFSLKSVAINGGSVLGDLLGTGTSLGFSSTVLANGESIQGVSVDLNNDTMLDIGSSDTNRSTNHIQVISVGGLHSSGTVKYIPLYRAKYDINDIIPVETNRSTQIVLYRPIHASGSLTRLALAPQWDQDAVFKQATTGTFSFGTPITIKSTSPQNTVTSVVGRVYNDANGNAVKDPTEVGIAGRTVYIDVNKNGVKETTEPSAVTDSLGFYKISTTLTGSVSVRQVLPAGWNTRSPSSGINTVTLIAGQSNGQANFADTQTARVSGYAFIDTNNNGTKDSTESALASVSVQLLNKTTSVSYALLTDVNGSFSFYGIPAGTYTLTVDQPLGYIRATGNLATQTITLTAGKIVSGLKFGFKIA